MSYGAEAADQVVRITLDGVEVAARLTGKAAERLAKLIYAIIKDQKRTKGKIRLSSMIRTGKPMKIFAINDENVMKFCKEAKKYGVMFCVLKDTDAGDGLTDIMIREEDVGKVNRIVERFDLAVVDMGGLKTDIEEKRGQAAQEKEQESGDKNNEQEEVRENPDKESEAPDAGEHREEQNRKEHTPSGNQEKTENSLPEPPPAEARTRSDRINEFLDRMEGTAKEEPKKDVAENPTNARTEKAPQSGRSSEMSRPREENAPRAGEDRFINSAAKRPSVKKQLEVLSREEKNEAAAARSEISHIAPPKKKKKRERGRNHGHVRE